MDEQTKLLTEIRDILVRGDEFGRRQWEEQRADAEVWQQRLDRYHDAVNAYQYQMGSTRVALYVIGAVEIAVVAWIVSQTIR